LIQKAALHQLRPTSPSTLRAFTEGSAVNQLRWWRYTSSFRNRSIGRAPPCQSRLRPTAGWGRELFTSFRSPPAGLESVDAKRDHSW